MEFAGELITIKWLLVAILVGVLVIAVSFAVIAVVAALGFSLIKKNKVGSIFEKMADYHLSNADNAELVELALERIKNSPQDYMAYLYLGKAQYYQGSLAEAKGSFKKVLELEPSMEYSVKDWLTKINDRLEQGLQLVT